MANSRKPRPRKTLAAVKGVVAAGGPHVVVEQPAAAYSKLAAAGRAKVWACRACVVLLVYSVGVGMVCSGLPRVETILQTAAASGNREAVRALLQPGRIQPVDPDHGRRAAIPLFGRFVSDETPLVQAAAKGQTAIVEALLAAGAKPDAGITLGPFGTAESASPLFAAAQKGQTASIKALLAAGANPDKGFTLGPFGWVLSQSPLDTAVEEGRTAAVEALLAAGARPDAGWALGPFGSVWSVKPLRWAGWTSGPTRRRRDYHFAGTASPSILKRLLKGEEGAAEIRSRRWLGQTAIANALLAAGARPDAVGTLGPFGSVRHCLTLTCHCVSWTFHCPFTAFP